MNNTEKYWKARPAAVRRKQARKQKKLAEQAEVHRLFHQEHLTIGKIAELTHHKRTTITAWLNEQPSLNEEPAPAAKTDAPIPDPRDMEYLFMINVRRYNRSVEETIRICLVLQAVLGSSEDPTEDPDARRKLTEAMTARLINMIFGG